MAGPSGVPACLSLNQCPFPSGSAFSSAPPLSDSEHSSTPKYLHPSVSVGALDAHDFPQLVGLRGACLPLSLTSGASNRKLSGVRALSVVNNPCPKSAPISAGTIDSGTMGRMEEPVSKPPLDSGCQPPQASWSSVVKQSIVGADSPMPAQLSIKTENSTELPDQMFTNILVDYQWKPKRSHEGNHIGLSGAPHKFAKIFRPIGRILPDLISLPPSNKVNKLSHASTPRKADLNTGDLSISNSFAALQKFEMGCQIVDSAEMINGNGVEDELFQIKMPLCNPGQANQGVDDCQLPANRKIDYEFESIVNLQEWNKIPASPPSNNNNQFASMSGKSVFHSHDNQNAEDTSDGKVSYPVSRCHQDGGNIGPPLLKVIMECTALWWILPILGMLPGSPKACERGNMKFDPRVELSVDGVDLDLTLNSITKLSCKCLQDTSEQVEEVVDNEDNLHDPMLNAIKMLLEANVIETYLDSLTPEGRQNVHVFIEKCLLARRSDKRVSDVYSNHAQEGVPQVTTPYSLEHDGT
ncbi:hypothetical protein Nepgr_030936 [Nepenthes gracilis]|uniref:Uncharacterized protein n=1 Tax=Nepenthes gracilis TaxID=150966 RepID=A0AAD3THH5_NEPGR|nr:hypothetical protein Nepgr_030936 [Nepenthes gracilis]